VLGLGIGNAQKLGYSHKSVFWRTRDNKLEEENDRRPNFFIFWPNEVPKKLS
jgi:hypothetical protein